MFAITQGVEDLKQDQVAVLTSLATSLMVGMSWVQYSSPSSSPSQEINKKRF